MAAVEPREKVDRDELFLEITKSVCPVCKTVIDEPDAGVRHRPRWTLVDAAWTSKPAAAASLESGTAD